MAIGSYTNSGYSTTCQRQRSANGVPSAGTHDIGRISGSVLKLEEGSLYPALHRMTQAGWLSATWGQSENGRRARYYSLTAAGRKQLAAEEKNWAALTGAVAQVLRHA